MDSILHLLEKVQAVVWGPPTMVLLIGTGLYFTLRLKCLQVVHLPRALRYIFEKEEGEGDVSAFGSLCTALAATIGTGSIVGVATALRVGRAHFSGCGFLPLWVWLQNTRKAFWQ